jgi:hypothetical protein
MNALNLPIVARLRRNHALEHATIHVLGEKHRPLRVVGRSTFYGFYLYGDLPSDLVNEATHEALRRLRAGEAHLAVHPNCGTNLVAAGSLAGLAAFAVLGTGKRRGLEALPNALVAATAAVLLSQPLGARLQSDVTTMAELGDLTVREIRREDRGNLVVHFIQTG